MRDYKFNLIRYRKERNTTGRSRLMMSLFSASFLILLVACVLTAVQLTLVSAKAAALEKEEESVLKEKKETEAKVIESNSLVNLKNKAGEMGFSKMNRVFYLRGEEKMAKLP